MRDACGDIHLRQNQARVAHSVLFITWRRIERSDCNCYFWAWVECASESAWRNASKSAQIRAVVLPSRVLTTGSWLFDE